MRNGHDSGVYRIYGHRQNRVGVHWITDIIGGAILSTGLVMLYYLVCDLEKKEKF